MIFITKKFHKIFFMTESFFRFILNLKKISTHFLTPVCGPESGHQSILAKQRILK